MTTQNHSGSGHNISADQVFIDAIPKLTSDLASVANILSKRLFVEDGMEKASSGNPFPPQAKIRHNNIIGFRIIIDNYKSYVGKLSAIYKEFDNQGTNRTHILLENIKLTYLKEKNAVSARQDGVDEMTVIRQSADDIVTAVERALMRQIENSSNIETSTESVHLSLQIVLIDAFIRCKILEEPT